MDLALRAANYFYLAYEATLQLRAKRRGAP
jgi:hypothetical protein